MDLNQMYYGSSEPRKNPAQLKAGPLSMLYENGFIRSVCMGSCEVVRRIYMAARDERWNTAENLVSNENIVSGDSSFLITFDCMSRHEDMSFKWQGVIRGDESGEVRFTFSGEALSTFKRNRIGLCVLHPPGLSGQPCACESIDGTTVEGAFPYLIKPDQPFFNIRALRYPAAPGVIAHVKFEGDTFEMEDQRNWSDSSFKTYSTPQSLPKPVTINTGTRIEQAVTISVKGTPSKSDVCVPPRKSVKLSIEQTKTPVPLLGLRCPPVDITACEADRLQLMRPDHLRFDIDAGSELLQGDLFRAARICNLVNVSAEIALYFDSDYEFQTERLLQALRASLVPVRRFFLFAKERPVTPEPLLVSAAQALRAYERTSQIGTGTDRHFVEINRVHPPLTGADCIAYSVNPQVHTFDDAAVMENTEGQEEQLRTTRHFAPDLRIAVGPITLAPLKSRDATDPRQKGLFCAAWTTASMYRCMHGAAHSLTYFSTSGPGGVMETGGENVYPVYQVIAAVTQFSGGTVHHYFSSDQSRVIAFALQHGRHFRWIAANLTPENQTVEIAGVSDEVHFRSLDETTAEKAMIEPESFRHIATPANNTDYTFAKEMLPYSVLIIDN